MGLQNTVAELFNERPIWVKDSLSEHLLDKGLEFGENMLKRWFLLSYPVIYMTSKLSLWTKQWISCKYFFWLLMLVHCLSGFCSERLITFQLGHFADSGSEKDMILAKIPSLACEGPIRKLILFYSSWVWHFLSFFYLAFYLSWLWPLPILCCLLWLKFIGTFASGWFRPSPKFRNILWFSSFYVSIWCF